MASDGTLAATEQDGITRPDPSLPLGIKAFAFGAHFNRAGRSIALRLKRRAPARPRRPGCGPTSRLPDRARSTPVPVQSPVYPAPTKPAPGANLTGSLQLGRTDFWRLTMIGLSRLGQIRRSLGAHGFALALCAIVLLAGALRVYELDYQSLWSDEVISLKTTDPALSLREFWDKVLADTHPPIYYLLLRLSSSVFGQSVLAARALSAVLGILTRCAAATLPGSSLSCTARLALPLLIAASPGAAWYDREARSYALLLLLSTVIPLASIRFLRAKVQEDCQADTRSSCSWWPPFSLPL